MDRTKNHMEAAQGVANMLKAITSFLRIGVFAALMSLLVAPASAKGGEAVHVLQAHWANVRAVAFSPDGKYAASGDYGGELIIWNVNDGSRHFSKKWDRGRIMGLAFSPDSKDLFLLREEDIKGQLIRYSVKKGKIKDEAMVVRPMSLSISADGKYLAFSELSKNKIAHIVKSKKFTPVTRLTGHKEFVRAAKFSPDGKSIVTVSFDKTLVVWDAKNGNRKFQIKAAAEVSFPDVAFSPDSHYIAYMQGGRIDIADAKTGKVVKEDFNRSLDNLETYGNPGGNYGNLEGIAYHPDGHIIAASSSTGTIYLWDVTTGDLLGELSGEHDDSVRSIAFSGDGSMLISGGEDNRVVIWRLD